MRVLVVGGGAREHALCWRLGSSPSVSQVLAAPGNVGIGEVADLRPVDPLDAGAVRDLAHAEGIDLVVVGPEAPLVAGVADRLREAGLAVVGPSAAAARLESSKSFAKQLMAEAGVPTAGAWSGSDLDDAFEALDRFGPPYVVKADGLAAGKGVVVTPDRGEAQRAVRAALVDRAFGDAGELIVVEAFLDGPEVSLFALSDGSTAVPLAAARDYKRAHDRDAGPNTGGMGAFSPVPGSDTMLAESVARLFTPVVTALAERGTPYVGVLYAGVVVTADGPKVLEFNARFGDPEAQVVLPRLRSDLGEVLAACARGELAGLDPLDWDAAACVGVVLASGGYPGPFDAGVPIRGLDTVAQQSGVAVFHAATRGEDGDVVTAGGRVLTVSALGDSVAAARERAYAAADRIDFDGLQRRNDIAAGV